MIHITSTQTYDTVENLIAELNTLPAYNRDSILEVRTYDGWAPINFKWINGTFERVVLTFDQLLNR